MYRGINRIVHIGFDMLGLDLSRHRDSPARPHEPLPNRQGV